MPATNYFHVTSLTETCNGQHQVLLMNHPLDIDLLVGVVQHPAGDYALVIDRQGRPTGYPYADPIIQPRDEFKHARTVWAALPEATRIVVSTAGLSKKIATIKFLRDLTGLTLTESKYIVENPNHV